MKNTAGERSGCKTKHCWGSVSPSKSCQEPPTLSKLTHMIIYCRAALIDGDMIILAAPKAGRLRLSVSHSRGLEQVFFLLRIQIKIKNKKIIIIFFVVLFYFYFSFIFFLFIYFFFLEGGGGGWGGGVKGVG